MNTSTWIAVGWAAGARARPSLRQHWSGAGRERKREKHLQRCAGGFGVLCSARSLCERRLPNGTLFESPSKFPSGMRALADWLHARGLKLGVYSDRGKHDFSGSGLGMFGHEKVDAQWMASVGVGQRALCSVSAFRCVGADCLLSLYLSFADEAVRSLTRTPLRSQTTSKWTTCQASHTRRPAPHTITA